MELYDPRSTKLHTERERERALKNDTLGRMEEESVRRAYRQWPLLVLDLLFREDITHDRVGRFLHYLLDVPEKEIVILIDKSVDVVGDVAGVMDEAELLQKSERKHDNVKGFARQKLFDLYLYFTKQPTAIDAYVGCLGGGERGGPGLKDVKEGKEKGRRKKENDLHTNLHSTQIPCGFFKSEQ